MANLVVEALSVGITDRGTTLLDNVSFVLPKGRSKALIGRSGSGKSLIAASLTRLLRPPLAIRSGRALLNEVDLLNSDLASLRSHRGRDIFLVFQGQASLSPCVTVFEQVRRAAARRSKSDAYSRAITALEAVGLANTAEHYPFELSGGMLQRVSIAMAFALEPQVLIADEPTTGLDPCTQSDILNNLRELVTRTGASLLLITHDLRAAGAVCGEAIVLDRGTVVAEGTWAELEENSAASTAILDAAKRVEL